MKAKLTSGLLVLCFFLAVNAGAVVAGDGTELQGPRRGPPRGYWYVNFGGFDGPEFESLEDSTTGAGIGAGYGLFVGRNVAVEFESSLTSTDYDVQSQFERGSDETLTLDTSAVTVNFKAFGKLGRLHPFAGVGLGFGLTELSFHVDDDDDYYYAYELLDDEYSFLAHYMLGVEFRIAGRHHIGLGYRKLEVFDDFDWYGEKVDAGGDIALIKYRVDF
jgi:opacity protein-like surface antigen